MGLGAEERKSALQRAPAGAWLDEEPLSSSFLPSNGALNFWRQCPPVNQVSLCTLPGCFSKTWRLWRALPQIGPSFVFCWGGALDDLLGGLWAAGSDPAGHFGGFPWQRDVRGARRRKVAGFRRWLVLLLLDPSEGSPTSKWVILGVDLGPSLDGPWSRFR